ncbi:MoxR family ATPase [Thermogutta sp.]|uniref:AAA family ATPase n=1 Tax=Thermogutta sp. TaxID=1962930 RepID=UPI00321FE90F
MSDDQKALEQLTNAYGRITSELSKVIVGQKDVIEQLMIGLFSRGHCLLVGVPGLAKTLMIRTLASCLSLKFSRIQFTPDLMPSDITGTEVIQEDKATGRREFRFLPGPIFANIVLADEINRTPPKTQAALLEAMQEQQVTVGGQQHVLDPPFYVLATQNPIEQEGTYPLPEAQLDRFMLEILIDYPDESEELDIVLRTTSDTEARVEPVLDARQVLEIQRLVRRVAIPEHVARYAVRLARWTRPSFEEAPQFIRDYVTWGAGPRAAQCLVMAGKARAALHGRAAASVEDVEAVAPPVLRHRLVLNFNAEADGIKSDDLIARLLRSVPRPEDELVNRGILHKVS